VALLKRCVKIGCREGVSGQIEEMVDIMPLETSMERLRDIREAGNRNMSLSSESLHYKS
jgi:hypothetical protein